VLWSHTPLARFFFLVLKFPAEVLKPYIEYLAHRVCGKDKGKGKGKGKGNQR